MPYAEYHGDGGVYLATDVKQFIRRPAELLASGVCETQVWTLLKQFWDHEPDARPDAALVLECWCS